MGERKYRAGDSLDDFCRVCKIDRRHTVVAADTEGAPIRVSCGYCGSEHNYRGGPRMEPVATGAPSRSAAVPSRSAAAPRSAASRPVRDPFPLVSDRERISDVDIELLLRRVIREETGLTPAIPADKWRDGTLVLRPGTAGLQEKTWPIETFFHKVVMLRNRLRTLEQHINALEAPEDVKVKLQGYITGCYGSLTSFNVLFAEEDDQFRGSSGEA
jgi:hypothetical protein